MELMGNSWQERAELKHVNPRDLTKEDIEQALARAQGNKARAAELLGIHRKTLYRKISQLGIPLN
jgi:DNA-binding NtrC family response regulator